MSNIVSKKSVQALEQILEIAEELLLAKPDKLINVTELLTTFDVDIKNPPDNLYLNVQMTEDGIAHVDGLPIWDILPGELKDHHQLFIEYNLLSMKNKPRTTFGVHSTALGKEYTLTELDVLRRIYSWDNRAKASDISVQIEKNKALQNMKFSRDMKTLEDCKTLKEEALYQIQENLETFKPKELLELFKIVDTMEKEVLDTLEDNKAIVLPYSQDGQAQLSSGGDSQEKSVNLVLEGLKDMGILEESDS